MAGYEASIGHRLNAIMRFYVSRSPDAAEAVWRSRQQFERLPAEKKQLGHWYRYPGPGGLIEVRANGSGQWHADDSLPEGIDPNLVVDVPVGEPVPSLMDTMAGILGEYPKDAPGAAQIAAIPQRFRDLSSPERAIQMVKALLGGLLSVPPEVEKQLQFLHQASRKLVEEELVAGNATGEEVSGVLTIAAIADALRADPRFVAMMRTIAGWKAIALDQLAGWLVKTCWENGLGEKVTVSLDALRSAGEKRLETALGGQYLDEPPERILDIYYGLLLETTPYFLSVSNGYYELSQAPKLSADDLSRFKKKSNTSEEKLVRLMTALQYAVTDMDLSRLRQQQREVAAALAAGDTDRADSLVRMVVDLEFFYPPAFKPILLGEGAVTSLLRNSAASTAPTLGSRADSSGRSSASISFSGARASGERFRGHLPSV
jgi:hypothetical protein